MRAILYCIIYFSATCTLATEEIGLFQPSLDLSSLILPATILMLDVTNDGLVLIGDSRGYVHSLSFVDGKYFVGESRRLTASSVDSMCFDKTNGVIAIGSGANILLSNIVNGSSLTVPLKSRLPVHNLAFNEAGTKLAFEKNEELFLCDLTRSNKIESVAKIASSNSAKLFIVEDGTIIRANSSALPSSYSYKAPGFVKEFIRHSNIDGDPFEDDSVFHCFGNQFFVIKTGANLEVSKPFLPMANQIGGVTINPKKNIIVICDVTNQFYILRKTQDGDWTNQSFGPPSTEPAHVNEKVCMAFHSHGGQLFCSRNGTIIDIYQGFPYSARCQRKSAWSTRPY